MELGGAIFSMLAVAVCFFVWVIPLILIGVSDRTSGKEKFAWLLAVVFVTWFAWVFYLLLAPLNKPDRYGYSR